MDGKLCSICDTVQTTGTVAPSRCYGMQHTSRRSMKTHTSLNSCYSDWPISAIGITRNCPIRARRHSRARCPVWSIARCMLGTQQHWHSSTATDWSLCRWSGGSMMGWRRGTGAASQNSQFCRECLDILQEQPTRLNPIHRHTESCKKLTLTKFVLLFSQLLWPTS